MIKNGILISIVIFYTSVVFSQITISDTYTNGDFKLHQNGKTASILVDSNDYELVNLAAGFLINDIKKVTNSAPELYFNSARASENVIIIGSITNSKYIAELIENQQIEIDQVDGKWESYSLQVIDNPYAKNGKALVIVGNDRRGTAYGVFELSKQLGVSPWYWWADVPIKKRRTTIVKNGSYYSGSPSVKYRGIFINDEDWGMKPWSEKTFEPELGDIGPKTYAKVCELLLRLKANYLWPAMHECTGAFNKYPENKVVADNYGIIMGASHCEPLLFNNATEWDKDTMGEWNYATNRKGICAVLDQRIQENATYENVYTLGMRGIHDHGMEGDFTVEEQIELTEQAINDQRAILEKHLGKKANEIPQIFIPYAEVLHLYNNGLKVPDDVTLMWVDDNYGYIRRLSDPIEQQRAGGSGVYYHLAYLGNPHEYTWLNTTNPVLVYEEMKKAYDYGANKVWVANVGDIKPSEYNTSFFLDLAWNINSVNHATVFSHQKEWFQNMYGSEIGAECADIMQEYYQLNFERKPEFMGWGEEFASVKWRERIEDSHYSFTNYNEAENRLLAFEELASKVKIMYQKLPLNNKSSFFQLVYYPVVGASYMNHKLLLAQKNRWYASLKHSQTNELVQEVKKYHDSVRIITNEYESLEKGKWEEMMSEIQSYGATYAFMPPIDSLTIPQKGTMGILVEENEVVKGINNPLVLPVFTSFNNEKHTIKLYNTGIEPIKWQSKISDKWIQLSQSSGELKQEQLIEVGIDWNQITAQETIIGSIQFESENTSYAIAVKVFNPQKEIDSITNTYVEKNGTISIPLENFQRKVETDEVEWITYNGLGLTGSTMGVASNTAKTVGHWVRNDEYAHLEYDIYTFNSGRFDIYTYMLPTFAPNSFLLHRMAVSVDDESPKTIYVGAAIDSETWRNNVRRNSSIHKSSHYINKPGKHTVKIFYADPGVVFDKMVIDFGGLKNSYLGPTKTDLKDNKKQYSNHKFGN